MKTPISEIRKKIVQELKQIPQSTYQLAKNTKHSYRTTLTNLEWLEKLGKVERQELQRGTKIARYWSLK